MTEIKIKGYHVTKTWHVFRIPTDQAEFGKEWIPLDHIEKWLSANSTGPYKIFEISKGSSFSYWWENTKHDTLRKLNYKSLIQVDIYDADTAALFKLTFCGE